MTSVFDLQTGRQGGQLWRQEGVWGWAIRRCFAAVQATPVDRGDLARGVAMTPRSLSCTVRIALVVAILTGACSTSAPTSQADTAPASLEATASGPTTTEVRSGEATPSTVAQPAAASPTSSAVESSTTGAPEPTPAPASTSVLIDATDVVVDASSTLAPIGAFTYEPANTLDGDRDTALNHDSTGGGLPPEGQFLRYTFATPIHLTRIDIVNGYAKSETAFGENARVETISARIGLSSPAIVFPLADTHQIQTLEHDFGLVTEVSLVIDSVYPGTKYRDVAITDVFFYAIVGP